MRHPLIRHPLIRHLLACASLALLLANCSESEPSDAIQGAAPESEPGPELEVPAAAEALAPAEPSAASPPSPPPAAPIRLHPGFVPDPYRARGTSGGPRDAAALAEGCGGWIHEHPDHLLELDDAFTDLRVMVRGEGDVTLVIQLPDGSYRCNDDLEPGRTTDPLIGSGFSPGTHRIWVGSFARDESWPYELGISELSDMTPEALFALTP
ncbi:MAG: hypothetical protein OEY14_07115 [Myxococcales bacterium]|nr:hypothetical protein [Myxococcales bacterium]